MTQPIDQMNPLLERAGASWIGYGPSSAEAEGGDDAGAMGGGLARQPVQMVEHFGAYEAEYAAIRQRVAIMAQPQRSVVRVTGADRQDYLHRMVSQNVHGMSGGESRRSFQLGDKGRIVADMMIHHGDSDTWLELDRFDVPALIELLDARLFAEDVTLEDWTEQRTALAVYGPAAAALLENIEGGHAGSNTGSSHATSVHDAANSPGTHHVVLLAGQRLTVYRRDELGVMGLHLLAPTEGAANLLQALLDSAGFEPQAIDPEHAPEQAAEAAQRRRQSLRGRPIGWEAYNTARIEAGTPIFHIDFGPDSLPAEAGQAVLDEAVAFDKGCFLGQEIVARIHNLGHPKRVLVGLQLPDAEMPVAGTQLLTMPEQGIDAGVGESQIIGAITSSSVSALLGNRAIALAMTKWGHHHPGTELRLAIEGQFVPAQVTAMRFVE